MKSPLSPSEFYDLVSGRRKGIVASFLRGFFRIAEIPYTLVVAQRNRGYDSGRIRATRVSVPVISIGNLTMGGTGKTPMVAWLVRWLEERQVNAAIVSRGYGAKDDLPNDEAQELERLLPDTPHFQNPDRIVAAQAAIDQFDVDAIVLDDGFQHRRLYRNLDIVLIDSLQPYGFNHVFPRGSLREPLASLARADFAVLTRSECISPEERAQIRATYKRLATKTEWIEATHRATGLVSTLGDVQPVELLQNRKTLAFCGIGNPDGFRRTLEEVGCHPVVCKEFSDHHEFVKGDLLALQQSAESSEAELLVCTQKDLVKIEQLEQINLPIYALQIEMVLSNTDAFEQALGHLVHGES
jgi:tetraacyldisaccharide 4'-kinase